MATLTIEFPWGERTFKLEALPGHREPSAQEWQSVAVWLQAASRLMRERLERTPNLPKTWPKQH